MNKELTVASSSSTNQSGNSSSKKQNKNSKKPVFYKLYNNYMQTKVAGIKLLNGEDLFQGTTYKVLAPPSRKIRGFREYPVTPLFLISPKIGRRLNDIEFYGSYWIVSDRAMRIFMDLSKLDFAFMPINSKFDINSTLDKYWLCDVISVLDAVDEKNSIVNTTLGDSGERVHNVTPNTILKFYESVVEPHRVFRLETNCSVIICDETFKNTVTNAGLTGLRYRDASKL